jgi:DNA-binding transcriptional ArsR family regulator
MTQRSDTNDQDLEQLTSLFRLLSDKTRLNILLILAGGERNVTSLCEALHLPQPTVSHHLGLLRMHNVITNRRDGKQVYYSLNSRIGVGQNNSAVTIAVDTYEVQINSRAAAASGVHAVSSL